MKNCILITVNVLDNTLFLLLESIYVYGNISRDTIILLDTSNEEYINIIKNSHLYFEDKIEFGKPNLTKYQKVLSIDTCVIVKNDLSKLFDACTDDVLYVLDKGIAFSSHVYMFTTSELMLFLINKITKEEPYISYNVFPDKLYEKTVITEDSVLVLRDIEDKMSGFLSTLKDVTIMDNIKRTKDFIDEHLIQIINNSNELLEGNIFMVHHTTQYSDVFLNKAKNISNIVLNKEIRQCMEIGFNSGFSALLMLISNPNIHIECFDLGEHTYTLPCFKKIQQVFGDRITLTIGDSMKALPIVNKKYQLIHIDGGHATCVANSDIVNAYRLSKNGTILIMDDYDAPNLHPLWDNYVEFYKLKPLHITLYRAPQHDIKFV